MAMNQTCPHKRLRSVVVFPEPRHEQQFRAAVISIECRDCGQPFEFTADIKDVPGLNISPDHQELRVTVTEATPGLVH